jgi:hypothetical protein
MGEACWELKLWETESSYEIYVGDREKSKESLEMLL